MPLLANPDQRGNLYVTVNDHLPQTAAPARAPNKTKQQDTLLGIFFLTVIFVAGIGAGILLSWLILD